MSKFMHLIRSVIGREPTGVIAAVGAVLAFLVTFGFSGLTADDATNILAVVSAIGTAIVGWATVNTRLSVVVGVGRTLLILAVGYGLNLTQEQVGLAVLAISAVSATWLRGQNSPADTPISSSGSDALTPFDPATRTPA